jgi:pimeloyl-ACP methyl ester carboxylesterase
MPAAAGIYYNLHESSGRESLPVILIHGAGGQNIYWPPLMRRMPGFHCHAIDLPGHGKSEGAGFQTVEAYANAVLEFMNALEISQAALVGHSLGGAIALRAALLQPPRAAALGLISTGARLPVAPEILQNAAHPTTRHKAIDALVAGFYTPEADPDLPAMAKRGMMEVRPSVLHGDLLACDRFDALAEAAQVSCPTLVLCGTEDRLAPLRYSQFLANEIQGARLELIRSGAHMLMPEFPEETTQAVYTFLSELPYQAGG